MQVYRSLDIGTAKVTETEKEGIPHYLIDCREVSETYSAADFQKEGRQKSKKLLKKETTNYRWRNRFVYSITPL